MDAATGNPLWLFIFSSRRRHTRCSRDWSSDVCSSDLEFVAATENFWNVNRAARFETQVILLRDVCLARLIEEGTCVQFVVLEILEQLTMQIIGAIFGDIEYL